MRRSCCRAFLDEADEDLREAARLSRAIGGATRRGAGAAASGRGRVAPRPRRPRRGALLDEALAVARESDVGFHLLDRDLRHQDHRRRRPAAALAMLDEAESGVRGPLETCPGCRITLTVPAAIAAARAGDLDRARRQIRAGREMLATVVMRLPGWDAALEEVGATSRWPRETPSGPPTRFRAAAEGFRRRRPAPRRGPLRHPGRQPGLTLDPKPAEPFETNAPPTVRTCPATRGRIERTTVMATAGTTAPVGDAAGR